MTVLEEDAVIQHMLNAHYFIKAMEILRNHYNPEWHLKGKQNFGKYKPLHSRIR